MTTDMAWRLTRSMITDTSITMKGIGHEGHDHGHEHSHGEGHEGHDHGNEGHDGEIVVSLERQKTFGITTEAVTAGDFAEVIHTSGQILSAMGDEMTVVAKSSGVISFGRLTKGSAVGKGGLIATISSKELGGGDQLAKAKATFEAARKEYERDLQLSKDNIVSESHLDQSRLAFEQAKAEYDALSSNTSKDGNVCVTSPIGGYIKKLSVGQGDFVETGTPVAVVSQNRRLRLRADVSEKYYGLLSGIKDANFSTSYSDAAYSLKDLERQAHRLRKGFRRRLLYSSDIQVRQQGRPCRRLLRRCLPQNPHPPPRRSASRSVPWSRSGHPLRLCPGGRDLLHEARGKARTVRRKEVLVKSGLNEGEVIVQTGAMQVKLASVVAAPAGHTHSH